MISITIVSATRWNEQDFYENSALGRCIKETYSRYRLKIDLFCNNGSSLATCYNRSIAAAENEDEILVFVHDDVLIVDFFWIEKLLYGFQHFDLLGIAGNKRRVPKQAAWAFTDIVLTKADSANLSGIIGHGSGFPCTLDVFGPVMQQCKLLDGVLLATRKSTLTRHQIRFDEAFKFHFYDMDLCRQFEQKKLRMGTIPLGLVHASGGGGFAGADWQAGYQTYLAKWKN